MKKYEVSEVIISVIITLAVVGLIVALVLEIIGSNYAIAAIAGVGILMSLGMTIALIIFDMESNKRLKEHEDRIQKERKMRGY